LRGRGSHLPDSAALFSWRKRIGWGEKEKWCRIKSGRAAAEPPNAASDGRREENIHAEDGFSLMLTPPHHRGKGRISMEKLRASTGRQRSLEVGEKVGSHAVVRSRTANPMREDKQDYERADHLP